MINKNIQQNLNNKNKLESKETKTFTIFNKKGIAWEFIGWFLFVLLCLIVIIIIIGLFSGRSSSLLDKIFGG